jgi:hypothetical protein
VELVFVVVVGVVVVVVVVGVVVVVVVVGVVVVVVFLDVSQAIANFETKYLKQHVRLPGHQDPWMYRSQSRNRSPPRKPRLGSAPSNKHTRIGIARGNSRWWKL